MFAIACRKTEPKTVLIFTHFFRSGLHIHYYMWVSYLSWLMLLNAFFETDLLPVLLRNTKAQKVPLMFCIRHCCVINCYLKGQKPGHIKDRLLGSHKTLPSLPYCRSPGGVVKPKLDVRLSFTLRLP